MEVSARMSYVQSCVQFVSTSGTTPNMSRMHELVIFESIFLKAPCTLKSDLQTIIDIDVMDVFDT